MSHFHIFNWVIRSKNKVIFLFEYICNLNRHFYLSLLCIKQCLCDKSNTQPIRRAEVKPGIPLISETLLRWCYGYGLTFGVECIRFFVSL